MTRREVAAEVDTSPDAMLAYELAKTIHRSGGNPSGLFGMLDRLVRERSWTRLRNADGEPFGSFTELVEAPEPFGLGTTRLQLRVLLNLRHPREDSDPEWRKRAPALREQVKSLLDNDLDPAMPVGTSGPGRGHKTPGGTRGLRKNDHNTAEDFTARLKRDDPDLAQRVVSGEIAPNAAAQTKGWRKQRVYLANPDTVARKIRESFTEEQIAQLIALLLPDGERAGDAQAQ